MIKNEYMKLSRDASHRRLKGAKEAMNADSALEGSGDKKASGKVFTVSAGSGMIYYVFDILDPMLYYMIFCI